MEARRLTIPVLLLALSLLVLAGAGWLARDVLFGPARPPEEPANAERPEPPAPPEIPPVPAVPEPPPPTKPKSDPQLTRRLIETTKTTEIDEVLVVLLDPEIDDTARNEAANLLRRSGCNTLTSNLIRVLDSPAEKERFRSFCVQHLFLNYETAPPAEREVISERLRAALADRHLKVRREALLSLARIGDPLASTTAGDWLSSEAGQGARDVAVRCAEELDLRQHIAGVRRLAREGDETTQVTAIGLLGRWKDTESRPLFQEAAASENARIRRAGNAALGSIEKP